MFDTPALQLGSYAQRILELSRLLNTVEHPGVTAVVNAGLLADGRPYVVIDVDGGVTLPQIAPTGTCLSRLRTVTILRGVCAPLIAAHDVGIVHGALDVENVFLVEGDDRYVKLLDWGIERAVFAEARRAGVVSLPRVACVAPEEVYGLRSPQTEAYSLGVLAHRLFLGRDPFVADSAEAMRALQTETRPDMRRQWPKMPPSLEELMCELLAPDPRSRPSIRSASERFAVIARDELVPPRMVTVIARPAEEPASVEDYYADYHCGDDEPTEVTVVARGRRVLWYLAAAACGAILAGALSSGVRKSDTRPRQVRATAPSIVASAPPKTVHAAAPPTPSLPPLPKTTAETPPPKSPPAPALVAPKPQATPRPATTISHKAEPHPAPHITPASDADARNVLLTDYQRLGRELLELRRQRGVAETSELWQQFRALKIEPAGLATVRSRADAQAKLSELRSQVERKQAITIPDACLNNPLADGCR